ncbi:hypothetical protein TNIN_364651 [Trichonephila inaurata madagascariensis]|uniref:Secreted protein n=1 Tax=Trichonephila inaurata madagascariensis TaxID=2747483 RepID=A0A8X7BWB6_9ARAC|nr:hypothetical protein TNIN_364651 [Trichonephila inaurata madagascariensis]
MGGCAIIGCMLWVLATSPALRDFFMGTTGSAGNKQPPLKFNRLPSFHSYVTPSCGNYVLLRDEPFCGTFKFLRRVGLFSGIKSKDAIAHLFPSISPKRVKRC